MSSQDFNAAVAAGGGNFKRLDYSNYDYDDYGNLDMTNGAAGAAAAGAAAAAAPSGGGKGDRNWSKKKRRRRKKKRRRKRNPWDWVNPLSWTAAK